MNGNESSSSAKIHPIPFHAIRGKLAMGSIANLCFTDSTGWCAPMDTHTDYTDNVCSSLVLPRAQDIGEGTTLWISYDMVLRYDTPQSLKL